MKPVAGAVDDWVISPPEVLGGDTRIDCGLAGTVMRFLPAVAALADGPVVIDGDPQARVRPMGPVVDALRSLGADIDDDGAGHLPVTVRGRGRVTGGSVTMDASASSQFISALLLAGARYDEGVTVHHDGKPVPSEPHILMTVETLRDAGAIVDDSEPNTWRVEPSEINALDVSVEPDLSNAGPFVAAALVAGGTVRVPGWPQHTTQAGDLLREILDTMGADVRLDRTGLTVTGSGELVGIDIDLHDAAELTPTVAALAALASTPTWIRGVAHIRGHETDRLAALTAELNGLGGSVIETDDGLRITPAPLHGGRVRTYHDHRMATAGAVLGLRVPGVSSRTSRRRPRRSPTSSASGARCSTATPPWCCRDELAGPRRGRHPGAPEPQGIEAPHQGATRPRRRDHRHGHRRRPRPLHLPRAQGRSRQEGARARRHGDEGA